MPIFQVPTLILPVLHPIGTEVELVLDALTHVSDELMADDNTPILGGLQDKTAFIFAQEVVLAGIPANLQIWIEESPYPTAISASFWGAIGGGGGTLPPIIFDTIVGTGVNATMHNLPIHWTSHSPYFRVIVQTPVPAAAASWAVQVLVAGKGT